MTTKTMPLSERFYWALMAAPEWLAMGVFLGFFYVMFLGLFWLVGAWRD